MEELDHKEDQRQELSFLLEQVTGELNSVQKRNEFLELANQNHQNKRRKLESKILELQHEYQMIKSTYSRMNGVGESSAVS